MGKEIELKAKINNLKAVESWVKKNCEFVQSTFQEDILYDYLPRSFLIDKEKLKADEFLRIRKTNERDILTHKIIRRTEQGEFLFCDEYESEINICSQKDILKILSPFNIDEISAESCKNGDQLDDFLEKSNFSKIATISKKRQEFKFRNFNISIDNVLNLGNFIEIENLKEEVDDRKVKIIKNQMSKILEDINIYADSIIKKGYLDLLVESRYEKRI